MLRQTRKAYGIVGKSVLKIAKAIFSTGSFLAGLDNLHFAARKPKHPPETKNHYICSF